MTTDPFETLGLARSATAAEIHAARRRLAKALHPDLGGDAAAMRTVNAAADAALVIVAGTVTARSAPTGTANPGAPPSAWDPSGGPSVRHADHPSWTGYSDLPAFTVEALPAECFEALVIVSSWIGEIIHDDPPYVLEVRLDEPSPCWCRLDLVPEAGASAVGISVARDEGAGPPPPLDAVRDTWIRVLNELDWDRMEMRPPS